MNGIMKMNLPILHALERDTWRDEWHNEDELAKIAMPWIEKHIVRVMA